MIKKNIPGSYIPKGFDKGFFLVELIAGGKFVVQLQSLQEIKLYCYKNYFFACLLCSSGCRTSHFWFHWKQLVIFSLRLSLLGNIEILGGRYYCHNRLLIWGLIWVAGLNVHGLQQFLIGGVFEAIGFFFKR